MGDDFYGLYRQLRREIAPVALSIGAAISSIPPILAYLSEGPYAAASISILTIPLGVAVGKLYYDWEMSRTIRAINRGRYGWQE